MFENWFNELKNLIVYKYQVLPASAANANIHEDYWKPFFDKKMSPEQAIQTVAKRRRARMKEQST